MRISKVFPIVLALFISVPGVLNAQSTEALNEGRSYKLLLQVVVGSAVSETDNEVSPAVRSAIVGLGPEFGYDRYTTAASLYGPLGINGQAQWKLVPKKLGSFGSGAMPIFAEWNIGTIESVPGNPSLVEIRRFLFTLRIPAAIRESVNYESIGLTLNRVRAEAGKTSVIGNLPVPETGEMLFFVVKIDEIR
ncbi:MAG TPA: hypothetical protein VMM38_06285 [Aridibacter sp.]|nr:hypothetical protein [Aridibacter sp.]